VSKNYYIITGTSRGLGALLSRLVLNEEDDNILFCLSRNENKETVALAQKDVHKYHFISVSLASPEEG